MTPIDMSAYKDLYVETAREYIETLKKNLTLLNENTTNKEAIYEMFRSYHSLKSQSHAMGYMKTAEFCKLLEDYFHEINDGKKMYLTSSQPTILETINMIEQSVKSIEQNNSEMDFTNEITNLYQKLNTSPQSPP